MTPEPITQEKRWLVTAHVWVEAPTATDAVAELREACAFYDVVDVHVAKPSPALPLHNTSSQLARKGN